MSAGTTPAEPGGVLDRLATLLAITGGCLSIGLAGMVVASITLRSPLVGGAGVPGDFEMAQMLTAVSVFCFLPYCQSRRGHVIVDAASSRWPLRWRNRVDGLWEVVAGLALGLLAWQLGQGAIGMVQSSTRTMVLGLPISPAVWICAGLCGFLALLTLWRGLASLIHPYAR